jgi:hypothetical protein
MTNSFLETVKKRSKTSFVQTVRLEDARFLNLYDLWYVTCYLAIVRLDDIIFKEIAGF